MSGFPQGFYFIDNATYGPIGLGGSNNDQAIRAQGVFSRAIFNVVLSPESGKYLISLIGSPKGFFDEQLNTTEKTVGGLVKVFASVPGSVDQQKWKIQIKDQTQDTYTISTTDGSRFWVLDNAKPGTQVASVVPTTQKEAWKFTKVTDWVARPLETGKYYIENFKNGFVNADSSESRVVSSSTVTQWGITKVGTGDSLVYTISILSSGKPANDIDNLVALAGGMAPDQWLIHPLPNPYSYMIFRTTKSGPAHWQLESNNPGTQVTVAYEGPVSQALKQFVDRGVPLVNLIEKLDKPDVDTDCFWVITAATD